MKWGGMKDEEAGKDDDLWLYTKFRPSLNQVWTKFKPSLDQV